LRDAAGQGKKERAMTPEESFATLLADGDMVLDRFDACTARHPGKTFLHYGEDDLRLTFAETRARTDRIAAGLASTGVRPGDRVCVFTRNALLSVLSMMAIWRIGAVFAPINFYYKGKLLAYQVRDTAPCAIITDLASAEHFAEIDEEIGPQSFIVHHPRPGDHDHDPASPPFAGTRTADLAELEAGAAAAPGVRCGPGDIANIIYTSGTTGPAKGVVQPYRWMNQYSFLPRQFMNADDVIYTDLPMYHVGAAFFAVTRALWHGNTVALWDRFSPTRFWDRICATGATNCILVDVMIPWLMNAPPDRRDRENPLRLVHMQPLPMNHHAVAQRFGIDFFTVGFGQTETGLGFCALIDALPDGGGTPPDLYRGLLPDDVRAASRRMDIMTVRGDAALPKGFMGRASPLLDATVLDDADRPCPDGEAGQLAFRPRFEHLMLKEYFNKPEITAKAFANGWFHTGDAARRMADGSFEFIDRLGGFLRVRGENISSYQIEDLLNGHPSIQAVAVVPVPAAVGDEEDVAVFIELRPGATLSETELHAYAQQVMPRFMQPRHVRFVEALPLTPTNKVEKYKLKQALLAELAG
jgi:crotonobetaine/carnitine-CoA ligase